MSNIERTPGVSQQRHDRAVEIGLKLEPLKGYGGVGYIVNTLAGEHLGFIYPWEQETLFVGNQMKRFPRSESGYPVKVGDSPLRYVENMGQAFRLFQLI